MTLNVILNKDSRRPIELIGRWSIDMGAVPTQTEHKLTGIWPIDMGAFSTQTKHKMIGIWLIDMGTAPKHKLKLTR